MMSIPGVPAQFSHFAPAATRPVTLLCSFTAVHEEPVHDMV